MRIENAGKVSRKGIPHGGDEFTGMYIYRVLQNPLYLGLTKHYDKTYPGEHEAIIDKKTWDKAQELLAFNLTHSGKKAGNALRRGDDGNIYPEKG